ncbi:MAG: serine/threonine-protein kinase, partial [Dermatophilaceae bacterium]
MDTCPHVPGYRIGELIARGSSATVWAAAPSDSDRDLAIKVVPLDRGDDGDGLARELSALAATRGSDNHLVRVLDVVAVSDPVSAVAIVMERLRHGTLTRLVTTRGHLTPAEVVTVLTPVALTAAHLHDTAVVHGDFSPSNIGFDARGRPVVLDLGVCSIIGTPREEIWGTPGFVAPEVVAGEPPTPSADVYAIGAVGWYALTGEPPSIPAERPPLGTLLPEVPNMMRSALERALHPDPSLRGDGRELATAIYGSTPAAPIEPGEGTDEATMLTHRVRELARAAEPDRGFGSRQTRRGRHTDLRARSRQAHLRVVTTFVAAVLIGVVGVVAATAGRGAEPTPVAPAAASPRAPVAAPTEPGRPSDYSAIIEGLIEARARAWTMGDPAA